MLLVLAEDQKVVREADQAQIFPEQGLVEMVQIKIREERRDGRAQRDAFRRPPGRLKVRDRCLEPYLYEIYDPHILNQLGHLAHQALLIDLGEEGGDVGVDDPAEALIPVLHDAADGLIDRAPAPIGEAAVLELGLEEGCEHERRRRLQHPIPYRGHRELPWLLAGRFHDDAQKRARLVGTFNDLVAKRDEVGIEIKLKLLQRLPVAARAAPVSSHPMPSITQSGENKDLMQEGGHGDSAFRWLGCGIGSMP